MCKQATLLVTFSTLSFFFFDRPVYWKVPNPYTIVGIEPSFEMTEALME